MLELPEHMLDMMVIIVESAIASQPSPDLIGICTPKATLASSASAPSVRS